MCKKLNLLGERFWNGLKLKMCLYSNLLIWALSSHDSTDGSGNAQ